MGRFHPHQGHAPHDPHSHGPDDQHHGHEVGDHSGYETGSLRVDVLQDILGENERTADANRTDFANAGVRVVNVMSSPGAGKTTLLRKVLLRLDGTVRAGVVEGDIETAIDAELLAETGVPVALVNTSDGFGGECHLDATMVRSALPRLPLDDLDLVVISDFAGIEVHANDGTGKFTNVTASVISEHSSFGMSHTFADFDTDGQLDIYVTGMGSTTARRLDIEP